MELTMTNGFSELSFNEMEMLDGGGFPWKKTFEVARAINPAIRMASEMDNDDWRGVGYAGASVCGVVALVASGPVAVVAGIASIVWCAHDALS